MDPRKVLLVVEDDKPLRTALVDKLRHEGFSVLEANDGEDGLTKSLTYKPNLILLDLLMPHMDGATMMDKLRADSWGKEVPIIILTNYDADDKILQKVVADLPAYYCLKASTPLEELVQKIKGVLSSPSVIDQN